MKQLFSTLIIKYLLSRKSAYYNYFWRIMWHWRFE